jgi:hypothetical protein
MSAVHVFGIRHHGPGSARSLVQALQDTQPDMLLVEGPPDANDLIPLAARAEMHPPVALLVYAQDAPAQAVYYPLAVFSPEWQALQFASTRHIPVRFMDLPVSVHLAQACAAQAAAPPETADGTLPEPPLTPSQDAPALTQDPLLYLAQAAGYDDGERWWEHLVEERRDGAEVFQAITEAMIALRQAVGETLHPPDTPAHQRERQREAAMRQAIRAAEQQGSHRIAVVCGAWHVPALLELPVAVEDAALLQRLPHLPVVSTWIPWTHGRLQAASGYGAGVRAPGWYHHLWTTPQQVSTRWMARVARLLRQRGQDISSAHLIEAVRLADTLAALRQRPLPGLDELTEATHTVLLGGDPLPFQLIAQQLLVGDDLGTVPPDTPTTPLQADLQAQQRRLRLRQEASSRELLLDLRQERDLERSSLLRRLLLLDIPWGKNTEGVRGKGTFKESWLLQWQPEFAVRLIEAGVWGNTIRDAATCCVLQTAHTTATLPALTALLGQVLFADLPEAVGPLMTRLQAEATVTSDLTHLMRALPDLAHLLRYGDVRQTDAGAVQHMVSGMLARICVGLPNACHGMDDEAAARMCEHVRSVHEATTLLAEEAYLADWYRTLQQLADLHGLQGVLQGRCCRLLFDAGRLTAADTAQRFSLALSVASDPAQAAAWLEGFLRQSGQILIHDTTLWQILDSWVTQLTDEAFGALLPLLRRTFSTFTAPERRQMGERVQRGPSAVRPRLPADDGQFDHVRAAAVLPLLVQLLGLEERV